MCSYSELCVLHWTLCLGSSSLFWQSYWTEIKETSSICQERFDFFLLFWTLVSSQMARSKDCCSCWGNSAGVRREIRWLSPAWSVYLKRWGYVPLTIFPQKIIIKFDRENCCYRKSMWARAFCFICSPGVTDHQTHRAQYNRWNSRRCLKRLGRQCLRRLYKDIMGLLSYDYEHRWYGYQAPVGLGGEINKPFKTSLAIKFRKSSSYFVVRNVRVCCRFWDYWSLYC